MGRKLCDVDEGYVLRNLRVQCGLIGVGREFGHGHDGYVSLGLCL